MSEKPDEPKIVVDEDWKERVRAEREAEREAARTAQRTEGETEPQGEQPPADHFTMLVTTLAAEAMIALGQAPDPSQGHAVVRPEVAKHSIDMLAMLEQKTRGNLTAEEAQMLSDVLHQLRMLYVAVYQAPESQQEQKDAPPPQES